MMAAVGVDGTETADFFAVEVSDDGRLVVMTRRPVPFETMDDCREAFVQVDAALADIDRKQAGLLVDLRAIGGRNDQDFEETVAPLRQALVRSFGRCVMLVSTFIGKLQVERHLREDGLDVPVFVDLDVAMATLRRR